MVTDLGMQVGQVWEDGIGDEITILEIKCLITSDDYPVKGRDSHGQICYYQTDGRYIDDEETEFDLIKLVKEAPCSGT